MQAADRAKRPYGVAEVAAELDVSETVVRAAARSGQLPAFKVGREWRFPKCKIDALRDDGHIERG